MVKPKTFTEEEVARIDLRRQKQISNQIASINRLLEQGSTYDNEMKVLHERLATSQEELDYVRGERDSLLQRLDKLEGGKS